MPLTLPQRVAEVAQAAERLQRRYAWAWWIAGALVVVSVLGTVDALWRGHDWGTRLLLSTTAAVTLAALAWRLFAPSRQTHTESLEVARRIDRFYPQLGNRLASAISFLNESEHDPLAGSADLRRQVIAQTESLSIDLDFHAVLDDSRSRQAARVLLGVAAAAVVLGLLFPMATAYSLSRLALPLARIDWPRQHHLRWATAPERLAAGQDLELALEDAGGRLPDDVELQLYFPHSGETQRRQMKPLGGKMVYRLENVTEPFRYRALGGDDDSLLWRQLDVVEPPQLVDIAMDVTPPAYTGWTAQRAGRLARVLAGSQMKISGQADRAILGIKLVADNTQSAPIAGQVAADGLSFAIPAIGESPIIAHESSRWHLELAVEGGVVSLASEGVELRVLPDRPPVIVWKTPADSAYVTPQAKLRISSLISDDLGLARVELHVLKGEASSDGATVITLFDNAARVDLVSSLEQIAEGVRRNIDFRWNLRDSLPVQPGEVLTASLVASDFLPQASTSPARRLLVISVEEFQQRVQQRQGAILGQLADVLRLTRDARNQTRELELRWNETKSLAAGDLTRLQNGELIQRQVEQQLADPATGVQSQVEQLLADLADNQLEGLASAKQLQDLRQELARLIREPLPRANQAIGATLKDLRARFDPSSAAPRDSDSTQPLASLKVAGTAQEELIISLEHSLALLSQWDTLARLAREVGRIRQEEQKLREQAESLRLRLAAAVEGDAGQRIAESKQLSQQQFDLGRQFDRTFARMGELQQKLAESQPGEVNGSALLLADALDVAKNAAISGLLQEAAGNLATAKAGSATEIQDRALVGLSAMLDALSGQATNELKRRLENLEAASGQLDALQIRQDQQRQATDQAAEERNANQQKRKLDHVARAEDRLAQEVQELKRQLERLRSRPAAEAAEHAADQLAAAAAIASRGEAADAKEAAREAKRLLEEAKKQLQAAVKQAQADLVQEEMARLEQHLVGLAARQQSLLEETQRLENRRLKQEGNWQRSQLASLKASAEEQRGLVEETQRLATGLQSPSFQLALRGVSQEMERAAGGLDRSEAGATTQQAERAALNRLNQLRKVLDEQEEPPPPGEALPEGAEGAEQPPNVQSVNELKLLVLLQGELNRRTSELNAQREKAGEWTPELGRQLVELSAEQGRVADIIFNLLTRAKAETKAEEDLQPPKPVKENQE